jgi:hypothetical protein
MACPVARGRKATEEFLNSGGGHHEKTENGTTLSPQLSVTIKINQNYALPAKTALKECPGSLTG